MKPPIHLYYILPCLPMVCNGWGAFQDFYKLNKTVITENMNIFIETKGKYHNILEHESIIGMFEFIDSNDLSGYVVTSPFHYFSVIKLRQKYSLNRGAAVPADLVIWSKGNPDDILGTKIGGFPYWPASLPINPDIINNDLKFVAQINFSDSYDLVPELNNTILSIWKRGSLQPFNEGLVCYKITIDNINSEYIRKDSFCHPELINISFHANLIRTNDYPSMRELAFEFIDNQPYNVSVWSGSKFGGVPNLPQSLCDDWTGQKFIFQLSSIQPAANIMYPFINHQDSLILGNDINGVYNKYNSFIFSDMGTIAFFLSNNGRVLYYSEGY